MIRDYHVIRESAKRIAEAANRTTASLVDGRVEQEPAFTDRMLGRIEEAMREFEVHGVRWTAKTLTDRAPGAQEKTYGADFLGVLQISLEDYAVSKGFLAQAKLIEPKDSMSRRDFDRMEQQCGDMLELSPDSFVFLYSSLDIRVVPALSVVSAGHRNPHELYSRSIARFYEEHFECFIGDRQIHAPRIEVLKELRERMNARSALYLGATAG